MDAQSVFVPSRRHKAPLKNMRSKLKHLALSSSNTYSERMRAIDLLGELDEDAYDELADIAANGLSYNERMNALGLLERIAEKTSTL